MAALGRQLVEAGSYEVAGYQVGVEQGGDECAVLFATRAQFRHAQVGGVEAQPVYCLPVTGSLVDSLRTSTRRSRQPSGRTDVVRSTPSRVKRRATARTGTVRRLPLDQVGRLDHAVEVVDIGHDINFGR